MKPLSLLALLSTVLLLQANAQEEPTTPEERLFEEAAQRFEAGDYLTAAVDFEQLIKQYPKSDVVPRAHFNRALCYYYFKDYETSEEIFHEILEQRYDERDPNGLMEPYALYKHHTCRYLASIALEKKDYQAAEKYINLFDKKYPYQHFCGNEWSAYDMYKAVMYAKVYRGTNRIDRAMNELLPHMFSDALASNEEVLTELEDIIDKHYSKDESQAEFEKALASLEVKDVKKHRSGTIILYGVKIEIEDYFYDYDEKSSKVSDEERYKQKVLDNPLFKRFL